MMSESSFNRKVASKENKTSDNTAAFAEAFFIANLLFIGIFYLALWGLYFLSYKNTTQVHRNHLIQALVASSLTTLIVIVLNMWLLMTVGYASATALITAEVYLMVIVPLFLFIGIMGFIKAINHKDYSYPVIGKYLAISD